MTTPNPDVPEAPERLSAGGAEGPNELAIAALVSQLPPSTPDDLAVERVWRRVTAPRVRAKPCRSSLWLPAAAVGALAVLTIAAVPLLRGGPAVELALTSGGVFSSKLAETWRAGQSGEALTETERLRTEATGRALFRIRGVAAVLLGEDSDVGLERLQRGTFLRLSQGTLTARVSKRKVDEPFVVQTDRYRVKVVGTLFTVEQGPGDHTAVSVREGIVEVSDGAGHVERVIAGQRWTSEAPQARTQDLTPDAVKTLLEKGLSGRAPVALVSDFAGYLATSAGPATKPARVPSLAVAPLPEVLSAPRKPTPRLAEPAKAPVRAVAAAVLAGPAASNPPVAEAPAPVAAPPLVLAPLPVVAATPAGLARLEAPVSAPPLVTLPAPVLPPAPVEAQSAYLRGRALEAQGDVESAARAFAQAADTDSLHGDIALYALGRLAQRRLHDAGRARAAFERYRERYPAGALLPEVDLAMLELEVDGHARDAALADSTRFLAMHPGSERVEEVHLLRGNLLRDAGRCREALADYDGIRAASLADEAFYSTAYCQRKLGDRAGAAKTLRAYLDRFPSGAHRAEATQALAEEPGKNF